MMVCKSLSRVGLFHRDQYMLLTRFIDILKTTDKDAAAVRADRPAPVLSGVYYYEVQILSKGMSGFIGVGFSGKNVSLNRLPGLL